MFSTTLSFSRVNEILLTSHQTYLELLSRQKRSIYLRMEKKVSQKGSSIFLQKGDVLQKRRATPSFVQARHLRPPSKGTQLNLWPLIHGNRPLLSEALQKLFVQLLRILYESCDFYPLEKQEKIARTLLDEMRAQKIESFEQLSLKDPLLDQIYYKMVKGSNTGYPPLTHYCYIERDSLPPLRFRFAAVPLLRAALGEALAQQVVELEQRHRQQNPRKIALTKKEFLELVRLSSPPLDTAILEELFYYKNCEKGVEQVYRKKNQKIHASHASPF